MSSTDQLIGPDEIDGQLNLLEEVKASFGVDDDYLAAVLANQVQLGRVERKQSELLAALADILSAVSPDVEPTFSDSYPFEFSTDVPADTENVDPATTSIDVPFDARVVELVVGWPAGAQGQVGVQFRSESGERFFPRDKQNEYVATDDFTHAFSLEADVSGGDTLVAQFINKDTTNPHFINVVATLKERADGAVGGSSK